MKNKLYLLFASGAATAILIVLNWIGTFKLCGGTEYGQCMDIVYSTIVNFIPIILFFLFSLITYWIRGDIYQAWFRFARWWIPLSMILILISPEYSHDWMYPIEKGSVAFLTSVIFAIISTLIIILKYLRQSR